MGPKTTSSLRNGVEHLETDDDRVAYLNAALEENNPSLITAALGDIARAKGMSQIAKQIGMRRESLYKALSPNGNPKFSTILKVINALGFQLHVSSEKLKGQHSK